MHKQEVSKIDFAFSGGEKKLLCLLTLCLSKNGFFSHHFFGPLPQIDNKLKN